MTSEATGAALEDAGDDLRTKMARHSSLLDNIGNLAGLMGRRASEEWLDPTAVAGDVWADLPTDRATLRIGDRREIWADREWLALLFEELFENALAHVGPDADVEVGVADGALYVCDDGPGMAPGAKDQVLESGYSSIGVGSGFGLTVVSHVAQAHDWELGIREGVGGGIRVEFAGIVANRTTVGEAGMAPGQPGPADD